ncbi:hypothetical protein DYB30_011718, partial [Aphanomyces astaci]
MKRKDKRFLFQEVVGLAASQDSAVPSLATATLTQTTDQGHVHLHVEQVRCVLSTRFLLKLLHYVCEGPLMDLLRHPTQSLRPIQPFALSQHLGANYHVPNPNITRGPARDVFFSPALTFDDVPVHHDPRRPAALEDDVPSSTIKWTLDVDMHDPFLVIPLHKSAKHASLELTHGVVLQLGRIRASWSPLKVLIVETNKLVLRSLHDDFEFIRPLHVHFALDHPRHVRLHVSDLHFQLSEVHAAMLVELYFQGFMPLALYNHTPVVASSSHRHQFTTTSEAGAAWHVAVTCDAVGVSLFTVRTTGDNLVQADGDDDDDQAPHSSHGGLILDMFALLPHDTTPVATFTVHGIQATAKHDPHHLTSVDVTIAQLELQHSIVSPGCTFQYRHHTAKHSHSWSCDAQAIQLVVAPDFIERVVVVGVETVSHVEHTLTRHQNQTATSELASSVYDDTESEYQWTERGRSNSIASSIHVLNAPPSVAVPTSSWQFEVACKLVQIKLGSLVLAGQLALKQDPSQLFVRLQHVLVKNTTPVSVSVHLQDMHAISDSISTLTTLVDDLKRKLRQADVFPPGSSGEEIPLNNSDRLQYSLLHQLSEEDGKHSGLHGGAGHVISAAHVWRHVCIDLPSIQVSVEGHAAASSLLCLDIEPNEFEWIHTPHVRSLTWKWHVHATYLNNRLLSMEPAVEPMTVHLKWWQVVGATPLQIEVKSVDEVKLNCTHALLDTMRLLTRMTLEKELASCVLKNDTASGPHEMGPGLDLPLQPSTTLHLRFPEYKQLEIPTSELGTRVYRLSSVAVVGSSAVDCVVDISVQHGCKLIVVQSTWLLDNKTATPLHVQLIFPTGGIIPRPPYHCTLAPQQSLAVPMSLVSFRGTQVYVKPDGVQTWTLVDAQVVHCGASFVLYATWTDRSSTRRVLSLCAPLVLHNALPTPMEYRLTRAPGRFESGKLDVGEKCVYHSSEHDGLTLDIRTKGFSWSQSTELAAGTISMLDPMNHSVLFVTIDVDTSKAAQWEVSVFVPYWILNQTGLDLEYQHELAFLGTEHINPFAAGQAMPKASLADTESVVVPPAAVKRKHQLLPSIPPNRGLLDLIPKKVSIASTSAPLLAVCHTHQRHGILKMQLRLKGKSAAWSNVISCECTVRDHGHTYVVGFVLEHGHGWYDRTQVLTLVPRFLLINALDDHALDVLMDESTSTSATLERHAQLPWHFAHAHHRNTIRIRFAAPG